MVVNGFCVPNTTFDPTLTYYGPTNTAVSCLTLLSSCITCNPSPLACTNCTEGTFLNGSVCQNCPNTCATCDSTGCLTCVDGLTRNGSSCVCTGACLACGSSIAYCSTCTLTGTVVTTCLTCKAGYYLSNNICVACSVGCAVCNSSSACTVPQTSFVMLSGTPSCESSLDLYLNGNVC